MAVLAVSPAISDHPQGWLQGKPGVTTAEELNCQKRTIVTKILCRRLLSSGQLARPVKDDVQCSTLEYLTDVGGVVFEGTGVEWMVGCVYSEAWNKHGKASVSDHKPKTYTQTGGQFKTNIHIY